MVRVRCTMLFAAFSVSSGRALLGFSLSRSAFTAIQQTHINLSNHKCITYIHCGVNTLFFFSVGFGVRSLATHMHCSHLPFSSSSLFSSSVWPAPFLLSCVILSLLILSTFVSFPSFLFGDSTYFSYTPISSERDNTFYALVTFAQKRKQPKHLHCEIWNRVLHNEMAFWQQQKETTPARPIVRET